MSLPTKKSCIFCGGEYAKVKIPEGYEGSTFFYAEIKTGITKIAKTVVYQCTTCGNVQSFFERPPQI